MSNSLSEILRIDELIIITEKENIVSLRVLIDTLSIVLKSSNIHLISEVPDFRIFCIDTLHEFYRTILTRII